MLCSCNNCKIKNIFFTTLKPDEVKSFCAARKELVLKPGEEFITQGNKIQNFKYLKQGLIKLHKVDSHNKEQIISFGKPMDFVSIHNIFAEDYYSYSVTTLSNSTICLFDMEIIKNLIFTNGNFAKQVIKTTTVSANRIIANSLDLLGKSMYGKVAHVILFFHNEIYLTYGFELPITRKEIAQYTGLSIETVIRVISEFKKDGLIKVYGKNIEILNKKALESIYKNS